MELPEGEEKDASYLTREDTPDTDMASEGVWLAGPIPF